MYRSYEMKILITGGAGYIGTALTPILLDAGHEVTIYDSLMYDGNAILPFFTRDKFRFVNGDITNKSLLLGEVSKHDVVIHLAALVGYAICEKNPTYTELVNNECTENIVKHLSNDQLIMYGSTGSNYGKVDDVCTEETPLNPNTVYAKTKTSGELAVMEHSNAISYRFATAFGASLRLRLDLLVNDLTYLAVSQGYILVYQPEFMRTFIHVKDMAKSFLFGIENTSKMSGQVYNVGSNDMNYTKRQVCDMIIDKTNAVVYYNDFDSDKDNRDYEVSYDKINKLGFNTTIGLEEGITELVRVFQILKTKDKRYYNDGI